MIGDEAMSTNELIEMIKSAKGNEKKQLLLNLCERNDDIANRYFLDNIDKKNMLPYLCLCRCHSISDYAAQLLDNLIDKLVLLRKRGKLTNDEMYTTFDEIFYVINMIMFKQSDKLFEVLERVGEHYEILKSYMMSYYDISFSRSLPAWLKKRAGKCRRNCSESNFIKAINHMLIITMLSSNNIENKIRCLSEKYPNAFGLVGLCEMFIRNSSTAFDKYGNDSFSDDILTLFNQLEYCSDKNRYIFHSEPWFSGTENIEYGKEIDILNDIDIRWFEYLTNKIDNKVVIKHFSKNSMFCEISKRLAYRRLDRILLPLINRNDDYMTSMLREYFVHNAVTYTNAEDFYGLELCENYDPAEIIMKITNNICIGINDFQAYYTAFSVIKMRKQEKLKLLDVIIEFLRLHYNDDSNDNCQKYSEFIKEAEAYRSNEKSVFNDKYYTVR